MASVASVEELLPGTRQANAQLVRSMRCLSEATRATAPEREVSIGILSISESLTSVATSCRSRFDEIDKALADHRAKFEALGSQITMQQHQISAQLTQLGVQQKKIEGMAFPALSILYGEVAGDLRKYCARHARGEFGNDFHFKVTADHFQALGIPPVLYNKLLDSRVPFAHPYIGDLEIVAHLAPIAKTLYPDEYEEHWKLLVALDAARRIFGPVPPSGTMRIDPQSLALPDSSSLSIDEKARLNALLGRGPAIRSTVGRGRGDAAATSSRAAAIVASASHVTDNGGTAASSASADDEIAAQISRKRLAAEKLARLIVANEPRLLEQAAGGALRPPMSIPGKAASAPANFKSAPSISGTCLDSGHSVDPESTSVTDQVQAGKRSRAAYSAKSAPLGPE